jgi:5-methylcytosine-specific restriction enzyme A
MSLEVSAISQLATAFANVYPNLTIQQKSVLLTLFNADNHAASAKSICVSMGLSAVVVVNSAISGVGRKVFKELGRHPENFSEGEFDWWHVIALGERLSKSEFVWILRPEICSAMRLLTKPDQLASPSTRSPRIDKFEEGEQNIRLTSAYERNPKAREACLQHYGCSCAVCGINFGKLYGSIAEGFIHVHHLTALSQIGETHEVDPIRDLRPVCPNCHAVIHMRGPQLSIDDARGLLNIEACPTT